MKTKIVAICLFIFISQAHAEVNEINNNKIKMLMESGVPLVDIRTEKEWHATGVINQSKLLTFFDQDGNSNVKKWMSELEKIASKNDPVIIICRSGGRSRIVANMLDKEANYLSVYDATNGMLSWVNSKNKTVKPVLSYR